jgi:membrane-bound serine protease (ClpP class)
MMHVLAQAATTGAADPNDAYMVWGFILGAIAVGLLLIEFLIPSGGLIGILCGIAAIGSVVSFFMYDATWGVAAVGAYIVLTPVALIFFFKVVVNSPLADRLVLGANPEDVGLSPEEAFAESEQRRRERAAELRQLIGAEGVTITALRPVGTIKINGQRIDGMAETGVIEANTPVIVTEVYDNQIKVRPA